MSSEKFTKSQKEFYEETKEAYKESSDRLLTREELKKAQQAERQVSHNMAGLMASKAATKKDVKASYGRNRVPSVEEAYNAKSHAPPEEDACDLMIDDGDQSPSYQSTIECSGLSGGYPPPKPKISLKDRPLMADTAPQLPALPEDIDLLRKELGFERVNEKVHVIMVAIDKKNPEKNTVESIRAYGDPIGGYAYTPENDTFLVNCCGHTSLGVIPMAFRICVPGYAGKQLIPLTESLIYKHAAPPQRKQIKTFKEKHPDCDIQFVQSLSRS
jgi:hypothetical protein